MHDIFIAKLGEDGSWLPLSQHLKDTADVMRHLCGKYVTGSMIAATGLNAEQFHQIAVFCAAAHDMGKAIRAYQGKITDRSLYYRQILKNEGLSIKNKGIEELSPHALAGATILNQFFHVNESVCEIIAAHHGKPRTKDTEMDFDIQLTHHAHNYYSQEDEDRYKDAWKEIFDTAMSQAEMQENEFPVITLQGKCFCPDWLLWQTGLHLTRNFTHCFHPE